MLLQRKGSGCQQKFIRTNITRSLSSLFDSHSQKQKSYCGPAGPSRNSEIRVFSCCSNYITRLPFLFSRQRTVLNQQKIDWHTGTEHAKLATVIVSSPWKTPHNIHNVKHSKPVLVVMVFPIMMFQQETVVHKIFIPCSYS